MIERVHGQITAECDDCGGPFEGNTSDWHEFIQELKDEGWRITKDGEEWCHYCPDCWQERGS